MLTPHRTKSPMRRCFLEKRVSTQSCKSRNPLLPSLQEREDSTSVQYSMRALNFTNWGFQNRGSMLCDVRRLRDLQNQLLVWRLPAEIDPREFSHFQTSPIYLFSFLVLALKVISFPQLTKYFPFSAHHWLDYKHPHNFSSLFSDPESASKYLL